MHPRSRLSIGRLAPISYATSMRLFKRGSVWWTRVAGQRRSTKCTDKQAATLVVQRWQREAADPAHAAAKKQLEYIQTLKKKGPKVAPRGLKESLTSRTASAKKKDSAPIRPESRIRGSGPNVGHGIRLTRFERRNPAIVEAVAVLIDINELQRIAELHVLSGIPHGSDDPIQREILRVRNARYG